MPRPYVSILIDTYNQAGFIEQAITSAMEQDLSESDREIIVVDDGSTDDTPDLVRRWEPRVRLLRKANGGQASAFNYGIPECRGEVVSFLDGDDWWAREKLHTVLQQFESNPDVGAIGHGLTEVDAVGRPSRVLVARDRYRVHLLDIRTAMLFSHLRWCLGTSRLSIRRPLLRKLLPVPEELVVEADEWIFTLAAALAPVLVLDKPLFSYRLHAGNLYQFRGGDERRIRRKRGVLLALQRLLPPKLLGCGIGNDVVSAVMEPLWVDSERTRLSLDGGTRLETFRVERAAYHYAQNGSSIGYRIFNTLVMGLGLVLPPRRFYQLKRWYADKGLARYRNFLGRPRTTAPVLEREPRA